MPLSGRVPDPCTGLFSPGSSSLVDPAHTKCPLRTEQGPRLLTRSCVWDISGADPSPTVSPISGPRWLCLSSSATPSISPRSWWPPSSCFCRWARCQLLHHRLCCLPALLATWIIRFVSGKWSLLLPLPAMQAVFFCGRALRSPWLSLAFSEGCRWSPHILFHARTSATLQTWPRIASSRGRFAGQGECLCNSGFFLKK